MLTLSAVSLLAQDTSYLSGDNNVAELTAPATLTVTTGSAEQSGVIGSSGTMTKAGAGTLVLTGANTYNNTVVMGGTLQIGKGGSSGSLGVGAVALGVGTSLVFNLSSDYTVIKALAAPGPTQAGALIQNGSGTVAFTKVVAVESITVNSGILALGGASIANTITIAGGALRLDSVVALSNSEGAVTISGGDLRTTVSATSIGGDLTLGSGSISSFGGGTGTLALAEGKSFTMSGGTFNFTLGTTFNQLSSLGGGELALSGGTLSFDTSGEGFSYGDSYQLFSGFGEVSFAGLTLAGYDTALYSASISSGGLLSFEETGLAAVPEPGSYAALAGLAALGVAAGRRRWGRG